MMSDRLRLGLLAGVLLGVVLCSPPPSDAHELPDRQEWINDWEQRTLADDYLDRPEAQEWIDHNSRRVLVVPVMYRSIDAVERWRPLLSRHFVAEDMSWAMRVMACESGGDPNAANPTSTASGLFQHLRTFWPERSAQAGWAGADIFDPEANVAVAAWLYYTEGPYHWVCK